MIDLDSHAGTIDGSSNSIIMYFTGKECDFTPYTDAYKNIKVAPMVHADTAYDNPRTVETMILIINKAMWMV